MKKLSKILLVVVISGVVALAVYNTINRMVEPLTSYVTPDVEIAYYNNFEDENYVKLMKETKKYEAELLEITKKSYTKEEYEIVESLEKLSTELEKNLKDSLLVVEKMNYEDIKEYKEIKAVLITNFKSNFVSLYLNKHFEKLEDNIYRLNEEELSAKVQEYLKVALINSKNDIKKLDAQQLEEFFKDIELYVKKIKGRYVFASNKEYLKEYSLKIGKQNATNTFNMKLETLIKEDYATLLIDAKSIINRYQDVVPMNEYVEELDYIYANSDYKNNDLAVSFILEGKGKAFDILDSSSLVERNLTSYINKDLSLYFANNSFKEFFTELNNQVIKIYGMDYSMFVGMILGGDPYTMIDNLGDELIVNVSDLADKKASFVLNTKDPNLVSDLLEKVGLPEVDGKYEMNGITLLLEDKKAFINQDPVKYENGIDSKNLSLYMKIDLNTLVNLSPKFSEIKNIGVDLFDSEIALYGEKNKLRLKMNYKYDELMNYIVEITKIVE